MKRRSVRYTTQASADLEDLLAQIALAATPNIAIAYVNRVTAFCDKLDLAAERGHRRDDVRPGLRVLGFERRVTIAFTVEAEEVWIVRIFYGGRDWATEISGE